MMLQVIGAGLGRTGTHSLGQALTILGFGPCYNILEVSKNPGHTQIWNDAIDGKPVNWVSLFSSYQSAVEWPVVSFLPEVVPQFPEVKVILTLRDPEAWYESAVTTIFEALELSAQNPDPQKRERSGMKRRMILDHTFHGQYRERNHAIEVYQRHNQWVVDFIPSDRLLQYEVKEGWFPLCEFLGKPIPDEPFPKLNQRSDFLVSAPDWAKEIRKERSDNGD